MGRKKGPENSEMPAIPAPEHLSDRSKAFWATVVPDRRRSPGRLAYLQTILEARDRADECAAVIAKEGMAKTTKTTKAVHVHPLVKVERECRQQYMRGMEVLGLTWDSTIDGRVAAL